jgi:murein endopeptidase
VLRQRGLLRGRPRLRGKALAALAGALTLGGTTAHARTPYELPQPHSIAVGKPWHGRLINGVKFPVSGPDWFTWDPALNRQPDRWWRRYGTDTLVAEVLTVITEYRQAHPEAPRVGVGDLSRPHGGWFGREYGGLGHASHQNGRDVDVYYPRNDRLERRARTPGQVDQVLAQDLVDRFVALGAQKVFVGPHLDLTGPRGVVIKLIYHDDHLHVRIPQPPRG